jgi:hypothetical protein
MVETELGLMIQNLEKKNKTDKQAPPNEFKAKAH